MSDGLDICEVPCVHLLGKDVRVDAHMVAQRLDKSGFQVFQDVETTGTRLDGLCLEGFEVMAQILAGFEILVVDTAVRKFEKSATPRWSAIKAAISRLNHLASLVGRIGELVDKLDEPRIGGLQPFDPRDIASPGVVLHSFEG